MSAKVIFYALSQKSLDSKEKVPEQAQLVMYYSLAIGHHVGVIDCLKPVLTCPLDDYQTWITQLPIGDAQCKMVGLQKFGEITLVLRCKRWLTNRATFRSTRQTLSTLACATSSWRGSLPVVAR